MNSDVKLYMYICGVRHTIAEHSSKNCSRKENKEEYLNIADHFDGPGNFISKLQKCFSERPLRQALLLLFSTFCREIPQKFHFFFNSAE